MRVLADGRTKFVLLTTEPAVPASPTAAELNAGIDLSFKVLQDNFTFTAGDSDKVAEKALGDINNSNSLGASNFTAGFTLWRQFADGGGFDPVEDAGFEAVKVKGSTVWLYARKTDKLASVAFAAGDEIYLGMEAINDEPQDVSGGGFIKYRIPLEPQDSYTFITVGPPPAAWQATHAYALNDQVSLSGGAVLKCTVAGTSGSTEPAAPGAVGGTVTDGSVTWQRVA